MTFTINVAFSRIQAGWIVDLNKICSGIIFGDCWIFKEAISVCAMTFRINIVHITYHLAEFMLVRFPIFIRHVLAKSGVRKFEASAPWASLWGPPPEHRIAEKVWKPLNQTARITRKTHHLCYPIHQATPPLVYYRSVSSCSRSNYVQLADRFSSQMTAANFLVNSPKCVSRHLVGEHPFHTLPHSALATRASILFFWGRGLLAPNMFL